MVRKELLESDVLFIVFEGIDSAGKTIMAKMLADKLRKDGYLVYETKEPTEYYDKFIEDRLREGVSLTTLFLLFTADRMEHQNVIQEQLNAGKIVICDRYDLSTYVYNTVYVEKELGSWNLAKQWADDVTRFVYVKPDIIFLLDVSPSVAMSRLGARTGQHMEFFERSEFLMQIREKYLKLVNKIPNYKIY